MSSEVKLTIGGGDESPTEVTYIPIRVLGKGAFGEATLYRRVEDNSLVVWKEVNLSRLSDKETKDSANEVDILSLLDHANIITYYNHFIDSGMLLIEMEYADGGNLYQKLRDTKGLMSEDMVIWYFYQLMSAVAFIHNMGIIHRDIKSLNIFLTKTGLCKVGDFGISKVMDSQTQMAESFVGTPYYMSPELIKGESYNFKSDIWACGCTLYELCTLKRVFDGSNPLKLAAVIVQTEFTPIDQSMYSESLRKMLADVLDKEPASRPTAAELFEYECMSRPSLDIEKRVWKLNASTRQTRLSSMAVESQPVVISQSTEIYVWGGGKATPRKLDEFKDNKSAAQIACGKNHFAVITVEKELYTWTTSHGVMAGQLGHGDVAEYKNPKKVAAFYGVPLQQVACGDEFTICLADDGTLYSFGGDYYGCLAQDTEQVVTPTPITQLEYAVSQVSAGDSHVVILTTCGKVFSWGCGEFGRLGHGSEDDVREPQQVELPFKQNIESVLAGSDCTFLITNSGKVLTCGNNEHNKLGLNNEVRGLAKRKAKVCYDAPCQYTMATVKPLRNNRVVQISSGPTHTAAVTNFGKLLTFGCNKYGQLGLGDFKEHSGINVVSGVLAGRRVTNVSCGDNFTVIATDDNQVFACGSCQDGRLGIAVSTQNVALPRPIFGSLYAVSSICSSHWSTLLVADKVLSQKTISKTSSNKSLIAKDVDCYGGDEPDSAASASNSAMMMSSTPAWIKREFKEADATPHTPEFSALKLNLGTDSMSAIEQSSSQDVEQVGPSTSQYNVEEKASNAINNNVEKDMSGAINNNVEKDMSGAINNNVEKDMSGDKLSARAEHLEKENGRLLEQVHQLEEGKQSADARYQTLFSENEKKARVISLLVGRLQQVDDDFDSWSEAQELT